LSRTQIISQTLNNIDPNDMGMEMNRKVRKDILEILRQAIRILREGDSLALRNLSDRTIHNASIFQDTHSVSVAVLVYALSKTVGRMSKVQPRLVDSMIQARKSLIEHDIDAYEAEIADIMKLISEADTRLQLYVHQVLSEARIKKGSRIYEHGISLAQTAKLLGTTQWELMRYIGQTTIADAETDPVQFRQRLDFARRLFR
jgi:hypothetical protein